MDTKPSRLDIQRSVGTRAGDRQNYLNTSSEGYGGRPIGQYGGGYLTDGYGGRPNAGAFDFDKLFAAARRQVWVVAVCLAMAIASAATYVQITPRSYTASAQVLIDSNVIGVLRDSALSGADSTTDSNVLSQMEVAQSRATIDTVVAELKAAPEGTGVLDGTPLGDAVAMIKAGRTTELGGDPSVAAAEILASKFSVSRKGRTSALDFEYTSTSPREAANVANIFAQVFISSQLGVKSEASRQAGDFLEQRLAELKAQAQNAERAVQDYRAKNGLTETDGRLLSDQQLAQLSEQFVQAQSETAGAEARYNQIEAIIQAHDTSALVETALGSGIINDLRIKYLDSSKRVAELAPRIGADHVIVRRLKEEQGQYEDQIFQELGRIAEATRSDMEVARKRLSNLEEQFGAMLGKNTDIGKTLAELNDLQRSADVYEKLYSTYLERYEHSAKDQLFPVSEVRLMSEAKPPVKPSWPRPVIVLALAGALGLWTGIGIGALREHRDKKLRSGDQIRWDLGLRYFGDIPLISGREAVRAELRSVRSGETPSIMQYAVRHPLSSFAETLRAVRHSVDRRVEQGGRTGAHVVGFASLVPGEGKTTVSVNFASLLAAGGAKVLLVDTDLRNPAMSRTIAPDIQTGVAELINARQDFRTAVIENEHLALSVLPINISNPQSSSSELLSNPHFAEQIEMLKGEYDYIVFDLPPIGPIIDVRVLLHLIDHVMLVAEWGKLPIRVIQAAIESEPEIFDHCSGVLLNKVDQKRNRLYGANSARTYLSSEYSSYYRK